MKLEVGKYYKSRGGYKGHLVAYDKQAEKYLVVYFQKDGEYMADWWVKKSGEVYVDPNLDLISEWVEPVEHEVDVWFYKNRSDGRIEVYTSRPTMAHIEPIAGVKVKFTEGEGL